MHRIWTERPMPGRFAPLVAGAAEVVGPGRPDDGGLLATLPGAHGIVAAARTRYDGALLDRVPTLRVIARMGIGVDNIAIPEATARGIAVCNAPEAPTISTAELAVTLLMAAVKHLRESQQLLAAGPGTDFFTRHDGNELNGRRLGLIGLGRIGSRVAAAAQALEMSVIAYDPAVPPARAAELGVELAGDVETVLRSADVVSLHCPLTVETRHLINAERLALMKPGAYLVNTARGGLVDEAALLAALESGRLRGAGLDVFETEPPPPDHPLLQRPEVIATPHIAGGTGASKDRLWTTALENILKVLRGERPPHLLNPEVWPAIEAGRPA
jgi:D-3-phosphoglycerate dehydrogenase